MIFFCFLFLGILFRGKSWPTHEAIGNRSDPRRWRSSFEDGAYFDASKLTAGVPEKEEPRNQIAKFTEKRNETLPESQKSGPL